MQMQTLVDIVQNPIFSTLLAIWVLPWKGVALWKASRRNDKIWFVALLVINTLGILEILYIFVFSRLKKGDVSSVTSQSSQVVDSGSSPVEKK